MSRSLLVRVLAVGLLATLLGCPPKDPQVSEAPPPPPPPPPAVTDEVEAPPETPESPPAAEEPPVESSPEPAADTGLFDELAAGGVSVEEVDTNVGKPTDKSKPPPRKERPVRGSPTPAPSRAERPRPGGGGSIKTISKGERVDIKRHLKTGKKTVVEFGADW